MSVFCVMILPYTTVDAVIKNIQRFFSVFVIVAALSSEGVVKAMLLIHSAIAHFFQLTIFPCSQATDTRSVVSAAADNVMYR